MTVRTLHDSSLKILNALVERGEALKLDTLLSGFIMFFALGVTSTALLFSGALFFIGIIIIIPLIALSILSFFSTPVVMSGIADAYMLQKKHSKLTFKNFFLGLAFCASFWVIPYIGLLLWFVLFLYCFGIFCEYCKNAYEFWKKGLTV